MVLVATLSLSTVYGVATAVRPTGSRAPEPAPAATPGRTRAETSAAEWYVCAERLREQRDFAFAAEAYQRVLAAEPYHREALFWAAICLASADDHKAVAEFMERLVVSHAKLSVEIFDRPEFARYRNAPDMVALYQEARSQARD
jgi:hypothetical protein